jgi:hypothetical protein
VHLFAPRHWAATSPGLSSAFFVSLGLDFATSVLLIAVSALVFHGVALLLGGRASLVTALRACCYLAAVDLLDTLGDVAEVLSGSTLALVLGLVALFFVAWALTLVGEHRYGLTRLRAVISALSPVFAAALLVAGVLAAAARFLPR